MSLTTIKEIMSEGVRLGHEEVHLTGGEPLVHPHLDEIMEAAFSLPFRVLIVNTNGTLLTESFVNKAVAGPFPVHLTISLDGFGEQHEKNRGRGTFCKTIKGLETALDGGLSVRVFTVVSKDNIGILPSFIQWLWEEYPSVQGISLIPVGDVSKNTGTEWPHKEDEPSEGESNLLTAEDILEIGALSSAAIISGRSVTVLDYPLINLVYQRLDVPVSFFGSHCTACRGRICVQVNGDITPCHPCRERLGKYEQGAIEKAVETPLYRTIKEREFEGCKSCPDRDICGSCRAAVLEKTGDILAGDPSCALIRKTLAAKTASLVTRVEELIYHFSSHKIPAQKDRRSADVAV